MAALGGVEVGRVEACWRHPVKSFQGFAVDAIEVDPRGVDLDRAWGLVDVATGRLLTAKRTAALLEATATDHEVTLPTGESFAVDDPGSCPPLARTGVVARPDAVGPRSGVRHKVLALHTALRLGCAGSISTSSLRRH